LADPVLNVYDSSGNLVATNNDWGTPVGVSATQVTATAATLTSTAAQVGNVGFLSHIFLAGQSRSKTRLRSCLTI
jgi:hypothetical protein